MISKRSRWLFTSFFALTALVTQAHRASAISGPMSTPILACAYTTWTTNESPNGPSGPVADTWYQWTCPFTSHASGTPGATDDWSAANVQHSFLDYTFPTTSSNDKVTFTACETSYSGSTVTCSGVVADSSTGYHETLGVGFSALTALGASGNWWDYYYVQVQAYNVGNWVNSTRTTNAPKLIGVGFN
jgi:hypothetical protein